MLFTPTNGLETLQNVMYNNNKKQEEKDMTSRDFKIRRVTKGLTQGQLAEQIGVSRSHITRIEKGDIKPSVPVAKRLGQALGVDWRCFFE